MLRNLNIRNNIRIIIGIRIIRRIIILGTIFIKFDKKHSIDADFETKIEGRSSSD